MKSIIAANAEQIKKGKRALMIAMTERDSFVDDAGWQNVSECQPGQSVKRLNHYNRHLYGVGDKLIIEDDFEKSYGVIEITGISLVDTSALMPAEIQALGYKDRADMEAQESGYKNRLAWYLTIEPKKARVWFPWSR